MPNTLFLLAVVLAQIVPPGSAGRPSRKLWREEAPQRGPDPGSAWRAKRLPRASWAPGGWNTLRWGMGPADVGERLRDPKGAFRVRSPQSWDFCIFVHGSLTETRCYVYFEDHALRVRGAAVSLEFVFEDDALDSINLRLRPRDRQAFSGVAGEKLFAALQRQFTTEYGLPSRLYEPPDATWRAETRRLRAAEWLAGKGPKRHGSEIALEWSWSVALANETVARSAPASYFVSPESPGGRSDVTVSYRREHWRDRNAQRALAAANESWSR